MYLSKRSRKLLRSACKTAQTVQGKYYSGIELARKFRICTVGVAVLVVKNLKDNLLVEVPYDTCPDLFYLTEPGKSYSEFCLHEFWEFFKCSVLCPIIVTFITEAIIHGLPLLLQLISQPGQ